MTHRYIRSFAAFGLVGLLTATGISSGDVPTSAPLPREKPATTPPATVVKLPLSKLTPAKPMFDACLYRYSVGTRHPLCQAYVNQALGMHYSYVWIEAVR